MRKIGSAEIPKDEEMFAKIEFQVLRHQMLLETSLLTFCQTAEIFLAEEVVKHLTLSTLLR